MENKKKSVKNNSYNPPDVGHLAQVEVQLTVALHPVLIFGLLTPLRPHFLQAAVALRGAGPADGVQQMVVIVSHGDQRQPDGGGPGVGHLPHLLLDRVEQLLAVATLNINAVLFVRARVLDPSSRLGGWAPARPSRRLVSST